MRKQKPEVVMLKNRIEKVKHNRNNNKVSKCEHLKKKECHKTLKQSTGSYKVRAKDLKKDSFNYRKKGSRLNVNLAELHREETRNYDNWKSNRIECERELVKELDAQREHMRK